MKIKNEDVTIRIGNKEKSFKNLILNNYIELFRDSFLEFKNKNLEYCFIKFNATQEITEESTTMDYDIILGSDFNKIQQTYAGNTITNKYTYNQEFVNGKDITDTIKKHVGDKICGVGFGHIKFLDTYGENTIIEPTIYAFLDVSKYNITVQEGQEVVVSRIDKVSSDLLFFTPYPEIKMPYHLSIEGYLATVGMEYSEVVPKLESIGFGNLSDVIRDEIPIEQLEITKEGIDTINIGPLTLKNEGKGIYPSYDLYPSEDLFPQKSTPKWIIYKFRMYRIEYDPFSDTDGERWVPVRILLSKPVHGSFWKNEFKNKIRKELRICLYCLLKIYQAQKHQL